MSEEVKQVHREPHPFVNLQHMTKFVGRTVAFVGRVDRVEDGNLILKTSDGKWLSLGKSVDLTILRTNDHHSYKGLEGLDGLIR